MRTRIALAVLGVAVLAGCESADEMVQPERQASHVADAAPTRTYEVTVTNLTDQGQPFTPPLVTLHQQAEDLVTVGKAASPELQQIAENGNLSPMIGRLTASRHVSSHAVGVTDGVPPLEPGESVTLSLEAEPGSQVVSVVSMLICTNDGFTGVDAAHLPSRVGDTWTGHADAYDAGTEMNTEDWGDLVPPCGPLTGFTPDEPGTGTSDPALAENGVIHHHPGIAGDADLDAGVHGWDNPVMEIVVERVN